jgi:hypothetical protein
MTHLTPDEFVDLLEQTLPAARRAHVDACAACRDTAASMGAVLARVADDDVPEPSPLFWDHLSARVRRGIETAPPSSWRDWFSRPAIAWTTGLASIALAVALTHSLQPRLRPSGPVVALVPARPASAPGVAVTDGSDDIEQDEAWALVRTVADEAPLDAAQAAGIEPRPGAAERIALEMSAQEQSELARLLEDELKRQGM